MSVKLAADVFDEVTESTVKYISEWTGTSSGKYFTFFSIPMSQLFFLAGTLEYMQMGRDFWKIATDVDMINTFQQVERMSRTLTKIADEFKKWEKQSTKEEFITTETFKD